MVRAAVVGVAEARAAGAGAGARVEVKAEVTEEVTEEATEAEVRVWARARARAAAKGTARERRCAISPLPSAECLSAKPRGSAKSLEHAATRSSSAATQTPRPTPWQQLSSMDSTW